MNMYSYPMRPSLPKALQLQLHITNRLRLCAWLMVDMHVEFLFDAKAAPGQQRWSPCCTIITINLAAALQVASFATHEEGNISLRVLVINYSQGASKQHDRPIATQLTAGDPVLANSAGAPSPLDSCCNCRRGIPQPAEHCQLTMGHHQTSAQANCHMQHTQMFTNVSPRKK